MDVLYSSPIEYAYTVVEKISCTFNAFNGFNDFSRASQRGQASAAVLASEGKPVRASQ